MRRRILKLLVLIAIFVGSNFLFVRLMNSSSTESASDLGNPTLPVVYMTVGGENINALQPYLMPQDPTKMRESVIPLTTSREITINYKSFGAHVESVSYEVVTPDTGERVGNAKIGSFRDNGESATATFTLAQPLLMDREYPIVFTMEADGREIYFYSRVLQRADLIVEQYIEFVSSFYQTCINKQASAELKEYIQPDDTVANNSFAAVNRFSSLELVTWGTMAPQLYRKSIPCIKEINQITCSITNDYLISCTDEENRREIYHVYEFYRLRYFNSEIMLVDFTRTALQEFDPDLGQITTSGVDLGVSTRDVSFSSNEASDIVAFVQDDGLWTYNSSVNKVVNVFTLHSEGDGTDERCDNSHYGIRILKVGETGDVDFIVFGYMNRGIHEGACGVSVCHYSAERVNIEERAFIPFDGSSDLLEQYVDRLSYLNSSGDYYLYLDDRICRYDLDAGSCTEILSGIEPDCFVSAGTGRYAAWTANMETRGGEEVRIMDMESGKTKKIRAKNGELVRVLGFINEDLIYGTANSGDGEVQVSGKELLPMKSLTITSYDGEEFKEYAPAGLWISGINLEEGLIKINRLRKEDGRYAEASSDDIMNNKKLSGTLVRTDTKNSSRKGTVVSLVMPTTTTNVNPLCLNAKIRTQEKDVMIAPAQGSGEGPAKKRYYIYAGGAMTGIECDAAKAVQTADALRGVVIDEDGQYIYERANRDQRMELVSSEIPDVMKQGSISVEEIAAAKPGALVLDLTGCTLDQILYYIGRGYPVTGLRKNGDTALLVGYDIFNTMMYNKGTGEYFYEAYEDSTPAFEDGGSVFVTYIESKSTIRGADAAQE